MCFFGWDLPLAAKEGAISFFDAATRTPASSCRITRESVLELSTRF